jgi:hypothetical protein
MSTSGVVDATETLSRYIYSRNHYRSSDQTVRYSAFIPPEDNRLSIFRISGLQEADIWKIGEGLRRQQLHGRADIEAVVVNEIGLGIVADDIPPRHANIIGWPEEASAIKLKAIELADKAILRLK